jgi:N-dimethylarginine dimethylaminohydrolase
MKVLSYLSHFNVGKVAMEASTPVASPYRQLAGKGFDVVVSHPKAIQVEMSLMKCYIHQGMKLLV